MRSEAIAIAVSLALSICPQAIAQHVELTSGKLSFDIPAGFKRTEEPGFTLYIEPLSEDAAWMKCSVKIMPAPTFGFDQAAANARLKKLPFESTVGSGKLIRGWYPDQGGVAVRALTFETKEGALIDVRHVYLVNGLFLLTIQADCIWPTGVEERDAKAGRSFLDSMKIKGR